jgi:hypothetical protein
LPKMNPKGQPFTWSAGGGLLGGVKWQGKKTFC